MEELGSAKEPSFDEKHASTTDMKPLPPSMRYEFLGPNSIYPEIANANVSAFQINSLRGVLERIAKL